MRIGIIGGTGVYDSSFLDNPSNITLTTPYGDVSLLKGTRKDKEVYFLERHSQGHKLIPSKVNYKANITALKMLDIDYVVATAAVGGINNCSLGDFVIIDQFIDFTKNRSLTFFDEPMRGVVHVDMSEPYCPNLRRAIMNSLKAAGAPTASKGTYICTEGPRFETPAEISMFKLMGADVVGMTNVPEVILARESELCYAAIAMVTNYAAGISKTPLTHKEVSENMLSMTKMLKDALMNLIDNIPEEKICSCSEALRELNSLK